MASEPQVAEPSARRERVYLLDAHGMLFQMFHGIPGISAPDGRPMNAVFGVTRGLMTLYDHGAEYLIAVFDHKDPTFRNTLDEQYKAHRPPPPEDLLLQEPLVYQVLEGMRIPMLQLPGFEADDLMATIAAAAAKRGLDVFLCTSDKDCRQLLSDRVKILNLRKGDELNRDGLVKDWGVTPEQVADYQALVGDAVDNVPGVPGVGPKTASKWLQQFGTLDNLIAHSDELGGPKVREAFKAAISNGKLALSRKLVELRTDAPVTLDWAGWRRQPWDGPRLLELFQEFGFKTFAGKIRETLTTHGAKKNAEMLAEIGEAPGRAAGVNRPVKVKSQPVKSDSQPVQEKNRPVDTGRSPGRDLFSDIPTDASADFAFGANASADGWNYDGYELVNTKAAFNTLLKDLKKQKRFTFDLETTSLDPLRAEPVGYAVCWEPGKAYYLAVRGPKDEPVLDSDETLASLKPIFEDAKVAKANQNIKYDLLVLRAKGVTLRGAAGDPMVAHYLLHAGERTHNLDELTRKYLGHENISITTLIGKGKAQLSMADVPTEKVKRYACEDADTAVRLASILEPDLDKQGLRKLYDDVEIPLIDVLAELEFNGVRLDVPFLKKLGTEMAVQLEAMEKEIHALAGRTVNIASPKQLREVLFDEMKLPVQKRTGTTNEPSTDQGSLERLAALGHELPKRIIDHRQVAKLKGTYVDALPALVNPNTGRVHTSFQQAVAATGRLSSADPNLQNIPARTEQGKQIRQAFIPPDGWQLITADYSQVELRLLAHFSGDEQMRAAFAADQDIHTRVAADIFKVAEKDVTGLQRRVAKTVNFGVIYGMSAGGLAIRLSMPRKDAEQFIDAYFGRYPKVLAYQDTVLANARKNGHVATILGRRRPFDPTAIRPTSTYHQRNQAEREAINMEIQGSAADLMKLAMLGVYRRLKTEKRKAKMLLTVHDELVFEAPPDEVRAVAAVAREEMAGAMSLSVPLKVDVAAGKNWLDVEDV